MVRTCAISASPWRWARGSSSVASVAGVDRLADRRERDAVGERGGDRGEDVATVEGRADRAQALGRVADVDGLDHAAERLGGDRQQAVVGSDEDPLRRRDAQRDRTARAADAGVDDREVHARRAVAEGRVAARARPARTSWRATPWPRSMIRARGQRRAITAWQTPTNSSHGP